jgi:hypothetical protein
MLKLNVDTLLSANGEAQAVEAQFDGADGEAAPSAGFLDELEDLWLEELATAESLIEGLQELQDAIQDSEFRAKQRDKQLAHIERVEQSLQRVEQRTQDRHELHMMQQKAEHDAYREVSQYYMEVDQ